MGLCVPVILRTLLSQKTVPGRVLQCKLVAAERPNEKHFKEPNESRCSEPWSLTPAGTGLGKRPCQWASGGLSIRSCHHYGLTTCRDCGLRRNQDRENVCWVWEPQNWIPAFCRLTQFCWWLGVKGWRGWEQNHNWRSMKWSMSELSLQVKQKWSTRLTGSLVLHHQ